MVKCTYSALLPLRKLSHSRMLIKRYLLDVCHVTVIREKQMKENSKHTQKHKNKTTKKKQQNQNRVKTHRNHSLIS